MKKTLFFLIASLILLQNCSKIVSLSPYLDNNLTFKVDNVIYTAKLINITVNNNVVVLNATADNDILLAITLNGEPGLKPYSFSNKEAQATISIKQLTQLNTFGTSINEESTGSFFLSDLQCDKRLVSGSFYFKGFYKRLSDDTWIPIEVKEGYFQNVKYTGNYSCPTPPIEEEENEFEEE